MFGRHVVFPICPFLCLGYPSLVRFCLANIRSLNSCERPPARQGGASKCGSLEILNAKEDLQTRVKTSGICRLVLSSLLTGYLLSLNKSSFLFGVYLGVPLSLLLNLFLGTADDCNELRRQFQSIVFVYLRFISHFMLLVIQGR